MNTKGTERINEEGATEIKVDTVDIQSPPGENKEATMKNVGVVHLTRDRPDSGHDKAGVLASAADATTKAFQSAKDSISGPTHSDDK